MKGLSGRLVGAQTNHRLVLQVQWSDGSRPGAALRADTFS